MVMGAKLFKCLRKMDMSAAVRRSQGRYRKRRESERERERERERVIEGTPAEVRVLLNNRNRPQIRPAVRNPSQAQKLWDSLPYRGKVSCSLPGTEARRCKTSLYRQGVTTLPLSQRDADGFRA